MSKVFQLPNGLTAICEERPGTGKVSMQVYIKSGSANEKPDEAGLTFLTQAATFGGTVSRTRDQISEDVESKGSGVSGNVTAIHTEFSVSALARHAAEGFSVLADVIRNPSFETAEFEKTRLQILQALARKGQTPGEKASTKFTETAFTGQAAGCDPWGRIETVTGFTAERAREKHKELLSDPQRIVVSIAGDMTLDAAKEMLARHFGDLAPSAAKSPVPQITFTPGDYREATGHDQLNLSFGFKAPSMHDDDRRVALMLKELIGGGMSSPLFQEVREKRGLVYGIGAGYSQLETTGVFSVSASSSKGNAGELMETVFDLLGNVIRNGFSDADMARARERLVRQMKSNGETDRKAASFNAGQMLFHGRLTGADEFEARLGKITSDDIRRVAGQLLADGAYALAAVGPQDALPSSDDIRAMMKKQLEGVTLPAAPAPAPDAQSDFIMAAPKTGEVQTQSRMTVLPNGLKVVTIERPGNLACGAWVGVGSASETPELAGATHMNEHMMFKGTASYGPGVIDRIVEGELCGGLNAYTSRDKTAYFFFNLKPEALDKTIDICGEMVFMAKLDHEEFDGKTTSKAGGAMAKAKGERDVVIEELRMYRDRPDDRLHNALMDVAYPDHPHGKPIIGSEETLRAMTVDMLRAYRDDYYAPNNVVFCAVGPVNHEDMVKAVADKFGHLQARPVPPVTPPVYQGGGAVLSMEGVKVCDATLVMPAVGKADAEEYAYLALSKVLSHGDSSRLNKKIVNEMQLTSEVDTGVEGYLHAGTFVFSANVEADKIRPLVSAFYEELRAVSRDLSPAELDKVKAGMEMGLLTGLESNSASCNKFACDVQAFGRIVTPAELSGRIASLTVDDVRRAAQKLLQSNPSLGIMAPPDTDPRHLPSQAEIVAMRDGTSGPVSSFTAAPRSPGL